MIIDDRTEPLVRHALEGAVKRDDDRLDAALSAFPDDETRLSGLRLTAAICGAALADLYDTRPSDDQLRVLAQKVAELEAWAVLTPDEVHRFLGAIRDGRPVDRSVPVESLVPLTYVITASLLSSAPRAEGQWWFNTLDRLESHLESAPEPA
jgi:hypothetical protein